MERFVTLIQFTKTQLETKPFVGIVYIIIILSFVLLILTKNSKK